MMLTKRKILSNFLRKDTKYTVFKRRIAFFWLNYMGMANLLHSSFCIMPQSYASACSLHKGRIDAFGGM
jgi:hypothetical protein